MFLHFIRNASCFHSPLIRFLLSCLWLQHSSFPIENLPSAAQECSHLLQKWGGYSFSLRRSQSLFKVLRQVLRQIRKLLTCWRSFEATWRYHLRWDELLYLVICKFPQSHWLTEFSSLFAEASSQLSFKRNFENGLAREAAEVCPSKYK